MRLLLKFYSDSFETIQAFSSWSEDVHIVRYTPQNIFVIFIHKMSLIIFFQAMLIDTRYLVYATPLTV